jgi:Enhancer of rudimentary
VFEKILMIILLVKFTNSRSSAGNIIGGAYYEFETVNELLDGVCRLYENALKISLGKIGHITYELNNLIEYIDSLADLKILISSSNGGGFIEKDKLWIKESIVNHLQKQINSSSNS